MDKIKLGFVPTRRSIFSAPDAIKYRGLTADRLREIGVDIVDIDDINEEGLLFDDSHIEPIVKKFRAEGVDGIMLCHANFGTEYVCARLARELGLPVLLWGPRDERPEPDGTRLRDSQCGLFATGKVLRRFQVPFTYMTNCRLTDPEFERGVWDFLAVCNVVKTFKHTRILQMATRPFDFWSIMCNEGELLEKFNIQLSPIPMTELVQAVRDAQADEQAMAAMLAHINDSFEICIPEDKVPAVAGLAIAMKRLVEKYGCNAGAIQCWNALQDDWTVRHPDNENGELLQHCGPWPCSCAAVKPKLTYPLAFDHPGALTAEAKHGDLTLARFDGDNGEYSLLLGNARGIDGPAGMGTYLWVEVDNLKRLEAKIVEGPYIHHCVAIHANVVPVLYEACKYIGIAPDLYDPIEEDVKAYLRGE